MRAARLLLPVAVLTLLVGGSLAQKQAPNEAKKPQRVASLAAALTPQEWERVDRGVDSALAWLATEQKPDGSFPTLDEAQPAVTSLCVLAYLSAGYKPGEGEYGRAMDRAIDFVIGCQRPDGLFARVAPEAIHVHRGASHTAVYNHAIAGLMLSQVYRQVSPNRAANIELAMQLALAETKRQQSDPPKIDPRDNGGWRYIHPLMSGSRSDLSVTAWQLNFLRSAKKAGFMVSDESIEAGVAYVESLYQPDRAEFFYGHVVANDRYTTRGIMGAAIVSLVLAGKKDTDTVRKAGDWVLQHPYDEYGKISRLFDRFHYSAYYCSNAMAQLGGDYWNKFIPTLSKTLLDAQTEAGSWASESGLDSTYGSCYPTALSVLSLTPAYQLLPIYQR